MEPSARFREESESLLYSAQTRTSLKRTCKQEGEEGREPVNKEFKARMQPPTSSLFSDSVSDFNECVGCERARSVGLDTWMEHLGQVHTFPSRWPSSKIDDDELDRRHPYTSVVDSHKKRKSKGVPRPLNSFMIFAQYIRRLTLLNFPDAPNVHISQKVGRLWRSLTNESRDVYTREAHRLQNLHSLEFPNYKYQPRRRFRSSDCVDVIDSTASPLCLSNHQIPQQRQQQPPTNTTTATSTHYCPQNPSPTRDPEDDDKPTFLKFNESSEADTLTSLQCQRGDCLLKPESSDDSVPVYQSSFEFSANRLIWSEAEGLLEAPQIQPQPVTTFSCLQGEDPFTAVCENWHQYNRENAFGEALSLPGIETWTFSGSTL